MQEVFVHECDQYPAVCFGESCQCCKCNAIIITTLGAGVQQGVRRLISLPVDSLLETLSVNPACYEECVWI